MSSFHLNFSSILIRISAPTTQFQCDSGATPTPGFAISCDGTVSYNGDTTFYECQTGDNGEANIYTEPKGTNCGEITLTADGCKPNCAPPPPPGCPDNLNGNYEYPHLIVPVSSSSPDTAAGTSYFGKGKPSFLH